MTEIEQSMSHCRVVLNQRTPVPFAVHLRTLLLGYCFTFPFTVIGRVKTVLILPLQLAVTLSFFGGEFCSRQMEYPWGDDLDDIPVRMVLQEVRDRLQQLQEHQRVKRCID